MLVDPIEDVAETMHINQIDVAAGPRAHDLRVLLTGPGDLACASPASPAAGGEGALSEALSWGEITKPIPDVVW